MTDKDRLHSPPESGVSARPICSHAEHHRVAFDATILYACGDKIGWVRGMQHRISIVPMSQNLALQKTILTHRVFAGWGTPEELCFEAQDEARTPVGAFIGIAYVSALFVQLLWVTDHLQRRGIGSLLLTSAEKVAAEKGCAQAIVETFSFHAPDFYLKLGYAEIGRVVGLGADGRDFRVSLRKDLR